MPKIIATYRAQAERGEILEVLEQEIAAAIDTPGDGSAKSQRKTRFVLRDGRQVKLIGSDMFRIVSTGEILLGF